MPGVLERTIRDRPASEAGRVTIGLEGCAEELVVDERRRREASLITAMRRLSELAGEAGDHATAAHYLRRAVANEPFQEDLRRDLMQSLLGAGDAMGAIQVYRDLRA